MASEVISTTIKLLGQLDPSVQKAMGAAEKEAGSTGKKISAAMVAGFAAVSAAAVAVVKQIADIGDEYQQASGQIAAATGESGKILENLKGTMKEVYADNFGEDMNDVANAISTINQQMYDNVSGKQLKNVTEQAFMLRDVFEYDIPESVRAANAMVDQFGIDAEYAMNLIATGAQYGLDCSGELLDTISEYSSQFAKVGFSADDMFNIMQKGADTGAWNLDKVGDAIKEMSIRVVDGSETTAVAFGDMGLDAEEMAAKFASGGDTARDAFFQTVSALANMDDKVQQNIAGVGIFGTMWEDLGPDVVLQLASISDEAYASKDAFENINNVKYDSLSATLEGVSRKIDVALLPLGEKIVDSMQTGVVFAEQGLGKIAEHANILIPIFAGLTGALVAYKTVSLAMIAMEAVKTAVLATGTTTVTAASVATWALNSALAVLTSPVFLVAAAIGGLIAIGVALYQNWDWVQQKASELATWLSAKWGEITTSASNFISNMMTSFSNGFNSLVSIVKAPFDKILGFIDSVKGAVSGLWDKITGAKNEAATIKVPAHANGGTFTVPHLAVVGDAPETIVPHGNTVHNQALLMEAAKGVFGSDISSIASLQSKIIDFPQIQTAENELEIPEDDFEYIEGGGDVYNFNVVINIDGNSDNIKDDVLDAEQEFERRIEQYFERKKRRQFA